MFIRLNLANPLQFKGIQQFTLNSKQDLNLHTNSDYRLYYVSKGDIAILYSEKVANLKQSEWLILPANIQIAVTDTTDSDETSTMYCLTFNSPNVIEFAYTPFLSAKDNHGVTLSNTGLLEDDTDLLLLATHANEQALKKPAQLMLDFQLSNLIIKLENQFLKQLTDNGAAKEIPAKFEWIVDWIISHCEEPISVNRVAEQFQLTPSYLTYLFNVYQHSSTIKFIHQIKISKAKDLLLSTNLSVKQIAYYLSFNNIKYFMRLFKQETGYTPTTFKNTFSKQQIHHPE